MFPRTSESTPSDMTDILIQEMMKQWLAMMESAEFILETQVRVIHLGLKVGGLGHRKIILVWAAAHQSPD
jgi:hypothetical protein